MSESLADVVHEAVERAKADERKPMTLPEFLLARIAEDEAAARKVAAPMPMSGIKPVSVSFGKVVGLMIDPARVLAECKAKRQIVELHDEGHDDGDPRSWEWPYVGCATLRAVALPYAEHPDFDPSWRL